MAKYIRCIQKRGKVEKGENEVPRSHSRVVHQLRGAFLCGTEDYQDWWSDVSGMRRQFETDGQIIGGREGNGGHAGVVCKSVPKRSQWPLSDWCRRRTSVLPVNDRSAGRKGGPGEKRVQFQGSKSCYHFAAVGGSGQRKQVAHRQLDRASGEAWFVRLK